MQIPRNIFSVTVTIRAFTCRLLVSKMLTLVRGSEDGFLYTSEENAMPRVPWIPPVTDSLS